MENISSGEDYREDIMDRMSSGAVTEETLSGEHCIEDIT